MGSQQLAVSSFALEKQFFEVPGVVGEIGLTLQTCERAVYCMSLMSEIVCLEKRLMTSWLTWRPRFYLMCHLVWHSRQLGKQSPPARALARHAVSRVVFGMFTRRHAADYRRMVTLATSLQRLGASPLQELVLLPMLRVPSSFWCVE